LSVVVLYFLGSVLYFGSGLDKIEIPSHYDVTTLEVLEGADVNSAQRCESATVENSSFEMKVHMPECEATIQLRTCTSADRDPIVGFM
jgi:hypothetical protein